MLERHETFLGEQYRRQSERRYAEAYRLAKENGLPVSYYRRLACRMLIKSGERLIQLGKQIQTPIEASHHPVALRVE